MAGRAFAGDPNIAALWQPWNSPGHPQNNGIPIGIDLRNHRTLSLDLWELRNTVISVEGEKDHGKSTLMKVMGPRFMSLQAGVTRCPGLDPSPNVMTARYHSRKSEGNRNEYAAVADFLKGKVYDLGNDGAINPFDLRLVKSEAHLLELAINLGESVKGSILTGNQPLAFQIAVNKMWRGSDEKNKWQSMRDISNPDVLRVLLRGLQPYDLDSYFNALNGRSLQNLETALIERPELKEQLQVIMDGGYNVDKAEFLKAAGECAGYMDQLLDGDYGRVIGSKNSLYDALTDPCVVLDHEHVPVKVKGIIDALLWSWMSADLSMIDPASGAMSSITPHLNFSDEEGDEMLSGSLMNARMRSSYVNRARAYKTADFTAVQNALQRVNAGAEGSELRSLGENIDRGTGVRFIFRQSDDPAVLDRFKRFGMSDYDISLLPILPVGCCVVLIKDHLPVPVQVILTPVELKWKLVESNSARKSMLDRESNLTNRQLMERAHRLGISKIGGGL